MTDLRTAVSVSKTSSVTSLHILQVIHESFLDKNYQTDAYWKVTDMKKIDAPQLENSFQQKKLEMELERIPEELKEEYLFTCYKSDEHINVIALQGLNVQQSKFNFLGDSLLGVILCKHADIQLKAAQNEYQPKCWLMVFKVLYGRKLAVHPAGNLIRKPTAGADCHISSIPPVLGETLGCQAIKSQVYLYETDPTSVTGYAMRPRQCVPQAYVEFVSCSAPGPSVPPVVHVPQPGIIRHRRISSPTSHQTLALEMGHHRQRFLQTGATAGCDMQLMSLPVSLSQQFPPYISKSSTLRNRQCAAVPVKISQPPNSHAAYSGMVNSSFLIWQRQNTAGPFVGETCTNRSRIEDDASVLKSGHSSRHELATGLRESEDCNNPIQILLINRNLVIGLLQTFAKEMNAVAGVWRASGCSVENTSCPVNAILAVQELRKLFTQIAPVCQQFYRFSQELFAGNTENFPSLAVVKHQFKCLRTCQSTMTTAFKNFHDVLAQNTDSVQKGIMMAREVLSKKCLLLHCLTSLQSTLVAFNSFHTSHFSGVVNEEHAEQNVSDLPVQSSTGLLLYNSPKHFLLKQPDAPTTAPRTASTISPSLASLYAMSGGEIGRLATSSRQESVNYVGNKYNEADKLQHQVTRPSDYNAAKTYAQRSMPYAGAQVLSDTSLLENSTFQLGLRLPIVIAPDDGFIDEVVDLGATSVVKNTESVPLLTSIKQEKTTSRDKRNVTETIFIDVDEVTPEYFDAKHEEVGGYGADMTSSFTSDGLMLDILDEQNPGTSLAKVFCISPDELDDSNPECSQLCPLSPSHTNTKRPSPTECPAEAATAVEDNMEFDSSAELDNSLAPLQCVQVSSATENVEPEFAINIEPTTEEVLCCEPALPQYSNLHSESEEGISLITAHPKTVAVLSDVCDMHINCSEKESLPLDVCDMHINCSEKESLPLDVCDMHIDCSEKESLPLGKTSVVDSGEGVSNVQASLLKKKKSFKHKPKGFVKNMKVFLQKFQHWTRRSYVRKHGADLKEIVIIKPKSLKLKCKASKTLFKKSKCKQWKRTEMIDAGDISAKVSNTERSCISEAAEVIVKPGLDKIDDAITESPHVEDFPVTESQIQCSSNQDLPEKPYVARDTFRDTDHADVSEKIIRPGLATFSDSDVPKASDSVRKSLLPITNLSNSETTLRDEHPFQNTDSDLCAVARNKALVCEKMFMESTDLPLRTIKCEPLIADFDLADKQKPRFLQNQQTLDDEIIAEVVANAAEFDGNNVNGSDDDTGFLKIRIENVCSIAPEGFESMDYSTHLKTESEGNVEDCAEYVNSTVITKPQSSSKTGDALDDSGEAAVASINEVTSKVTTHVEGRRCIVDSSEAVKEVIPVVKPTCLIGASHSQTVAKEQTFQEEELIDVGDAEYSGVIGVSTGQSLVKTSVVKDRVSDLVPEENFDDCDVEFDVLYENMSDENEDKFKGNEQNLAKCKGNEESEISDEVLKFYSMGGDNYETADVHSTLDLMTLNVTKTPNESTIGAESVRKQMKKRKRNRSYGRKRRKKKSTSDVLSKPTKGKLALENQDLELVLPQEKNNEAVSEYVVEAGKNGCTAENPIPPDSSEKQRKRCTRQQVQESKVKAFLVSPEMEKLCSALSEFGPDRTAASNRDRDVERTNDESINFHGKSEPFERYLQGKLSGNPKPPKSSKTNQAEFEENQLSGDEIEAAEEICEKDLPGVEDSFEVENDINKSHLENCETVKMKKRRRRYAMTGRSKRRKRTASRRQTCKRVGKSRQNIEKSDISTEANQREDDCKRVQTELLPSYGEDLLPSYGEDNKCADIHELVLNLFVKGGLSVPKSNQTCAKKKVGALCRPSETKKPYSRLRRISKRGKKRRTSSSSVVDPVDSSPESTLLNILNDDKFFETLKSAMKAIEGSSSLSANSNEPLLKVRSSEQLENSVEETSPVYFTDVTSSSLVITERSKSIDINAVFVDAYSESTDCLNYWKSSAEEPLLIDSLGSSVGTSSNPSCSENSELQVSRCSTLSSVITSVSYSALISAVDNASSSISYDAIRNALKTIASSNNLPPTSMTEMTETVEPCDSTIQSLFHNSVALLDVLKKTTCSDSAQLSSSTFPMSNRAADTSIKDSSLGGGPSSAKTVIPLSVYLRNVRQSTYKNVKDTDCNNEPAFYTGLVKAAAEYTAYNANQGNHCNNQIYSRDPRLARIRQQSSVIQPLMQPLDQQFPYDLPKLLPPYYSSVNNTQEAEMSSPKPVLTSPLQNRGNFSGNFHSFSSPENHSNSVGKKPVCSITPFIHQSEKAISSEQLIDGVPTAAPSKQSPTTQPSKPPRDCSWQLIPISNLPPRPSIIFARLPLSERKIDGFPSDPRIRSEKESCVRRQLSRPDNVCDDVPLVIDAADAAADVAASIKSRRASGGVLSKANVVSEEINKRDGAAAEATDWYLQGKLQGNTVDVIKPSLSENIKSQVSNSRCDPADDILKDLLSSLCTESFEGERGKNIEAGMLSGWNRVLGKRSHIVPKSRTTLERQQQNYQSSTVGHSRILMQKNQEHDDSNRGCDKQHQMKTNADQSRNSERDQRSHSGTTSYRHHSKDYAHGKRDDSSRRATHHHDNSETRDNRSSKKSLVEPRLDVSSKDSAVSSVHKNPVNKSTENSDSYALKKTPSEGCTKKRQHCADEKVKGADKGKRFKESHLPSSHTHNDERHDQVKSSHFNKDCNLNWVNKTKGEKGKMEPKVNDNKSCESTNKALQKEKSFKLHSSGVDKESESCVKQRDNKERSSGVLPNRSAKKSVRSDNEKNDCKEISKSQIRPQGNSKERQHSHGKEKHLHTREHVEKRHLSHNNAKEHAKLNGGNCGKGSLSLEKLRPEHVASLTTYSHSDYNLQQNLIRTESVHCNVNTETDTVNIQDNREHADEWMESVAATLSQVNEAGTLVTQDSTGKEHADGPLVIHVEDAEDEKDKNHLESPSLEPSNTGTDIDSGVKTSDTNSRENVLAASLCSPTEEVLPGDGKQLVDEVGERSYPSCYAEESCSVAPRSNVQIRADILKSIRSLKLLLEDKLKSDVDVSDVGSDRKMLVDHTALSNSAAATSNKSLFTASEECSRQQTLVRTLHHETQRDDLVSFSPFSDAEFDEELERCKNLAINKLAVNSETEESSSCEHLKTSENNINVRSSEGMSEKSETRTSFSGSFKMLTELTSDDLDGSFNDAEITGMLQSDDRSDSRCTGNSSDLSTKSDCLKPSVRTTESLGSSVYVSANKDALMTEVQSNSALKLMEFSDSCCPGQISCRVPYSTCEPGQWLLSECPEDEEKDVMADELYCATQEHVDSVTGKWENCTLQESADKSNDENWKFLGDQESNMAEKTVQVSQTIGGEQKHRTGSHDASDVVDTESSTTMACSHSGEDKGMDETWGMTGSGGRYSPSSAIAQQAEKCASPENCEQSALGISADADELSTSQATRELLGTESEFSDCPVEPANSSCVSCTVNNRKVRAADFFQDIFNTQTANDLVNEDARNAYHLPAISHELIKSEVILSGKSIQGLRITVDPLDSKKPVAERTEIEVPEHHCGNTLEAGDRYKSVASSEPSSSSRPSVFNRLGRRRGKIADEWSNISSGWKEMSRDHDEPASIDESEFSLIDCTELPADVPAKALSAYKEVFKKEMAATEQKIINGSTFTDPFDGMSECQMKKLLRTKPASQDLEEELQLECDILDMDKNISKLQECMENIRNQLSRYPSPALDRTYDGVEQKYNFLLVKKEFYEYRLVELRRYQKSQFVHVVPDEFLFDDEIGKYISLEGMLLFLHKPTISVQNCVRLAALKKEILQSQEVVAKTSVKRAEDLQQTMIKLSWLHLQRKVLLLELCCTTERGQKRLIQYLTEKLAWYRELQSEFDSTGDPEAEDVHSFLRKTVDDFESYIRTLKIVKKSSSSSRWILDATQTLRKRSRFRCSSELKNSDFDDHSGVNKRRRSEDVALDGCNFDQSTSSRVGWQRAGSSLFYENEDSGTSEDGRERRNMSRRLKRNLEYEGSRSKFMREQESMDFEDNREPRCRSRYHRGNSEDVWHEEGRQRWDCQETNDRLEQPSSMYNRPYYEDSDCGWSGHGYSDRYAHGWPERR